MVVLQGTWAPALQGAVYTLNYNTDRYTILIEAYARDFNSFAVLGKASILMQRSNY
jgi:hypothetical protein